ncbi:MAG: FAD-binding oxidoreductase [Rhizomicrobium sp.]
MTISPEIVARLKTAAGSNGFSDDAQEIAPHLVEWRGKYQGRTTVLLKPKTTAQVSAILSICNETRTPIVPQGGNTGLVGGQIPFHGEALLSLERMKAIRAVDAAGMTLSVDAGVTLAQAKQAASDAGRFFPLSLASEGSCTIGGNLSTNAGGVDVLRYGNARALALGLEIVLAAGHVLDLMTGLHKDNTGYDLKQMFIGAEGTLGVITAAVLKLFVKPQSIETALVAVRNPAAAVALLSRAQEASGGMVSAFELMPRIGIAFVLAHVPATRDPLAAPSPWYVLIEATGGKDSGVAKAIEGAISDAIESGLASDAAVAANEAQRVAIWKLRESMSEAQKFEGGSIKHDVSVAVKDVPAFLEQGVALARELVPGVRPVPFGHLGDGNIHFNLSVPKDGDSNAFLARWDEISHAIHDLVHRFGGSISAEHGVGVMKRDEILRYKSPAAIDAMRALKRTFDPNNILNPGKVVAI